MVKHMQRILCCLAVLGNFPVAFGEAADSQPNVVFIITDEVGFSDLGCYGSEINTPNIDLLAQQGLKFSQFYNCGKCEPSRAALTTGHQFWTSDPNVAIRKDSPNVGEILQPAGYRTMMVGKWHCAGVPFEAGFDRHFGFMGGATNFFLGDESCALDGKPWPVPKKDFYVTTVLSDYAEKFIREKHRLSPEHPFFLYLAYNAPHSPIQAPEDQAAKYRGKYLKGWDAIRKERFAKQQKIGLAGPAWHFPERPANIPAWETLRAKSQDFEDLRMATYAAMVDCVDQGVGRIFNTRKELNIDEKTLVIFMNDNAGRLATLPNPTQNVCKKCSPCKKPSANDPMCVCDSTPANVNPSMPRSTRQTALSVQGPKRIYQTQRFL